MATKKKTEQTVDVEFQEIMTAEEKELPQQAPVNPTIEFKYTASDPEAVSKWATFIDEDGIKILVDIRSIKRVEEIPHSEIQELFSEEELAEQPLWNKALSISFYDEQEPDPEDAGFYYGKSFDELKELLESYERGIKR